MPKLIEVLNNANDYDWKEAIYTEGRPPLTAEIECTIVNPDSELVNEKLNYILNMSGVQDIVFNAREQKEMLTDEELVRAFNFYCEHDAFMEF